MHHSMRYFAALFLTLATLASLSAQCPTRIEFNAQSQIDQFPLQYPNCTDIPGEVIIRTSEFFPSDIVNLYGLSQINSIGGNLTIHGNAKLETLEGLDNLTNVYGSIQVSYNDLLNDISSLEQIAWLDGEIAIFYNPLLSDCALSLICDLLVKNPELITVFNNGPSCSNIEEVFADCTVASTAQRQWASEPTVFPNPVQSQLFINSEQGVQTEVFLFNASGSLLQATVLQSGNGTLNVSNLPTGMYYLKVQQGSQTYTHKIAKEN